ncbi:MAG: RHS repeat-associated core domain-containing protein, partial [Gaiellales bacterium]
YDAAGHLLSAGDASRKYTFSDAGATTTLERTVDGQKSTLTVTASGESLILGADGKLDGQLLSPVAGVKVILDENGAPARWVYDDAIGNGTWTAKGAAVPTKAHLYSPDGEPVSVERVSDPKTPLDLVLDGLGWQSGGDASTLRLSVPITIMGDRSYAPDAGRWLQPDPTIGGSMNAYEYAIGDPINHSDPTGNAPSKGAIIGMVATAVLGIAIGALTFGIGTAAVAGYSIGAFAAQVAVGAGAGLVLGALGETIQQLVDNGAVTDLSRIGIAAGYGAAAGGAFSGLSAAAFKIWVPGKTVRLHGINNPRGFKAWTLDGYAGLRAQFNEAEIAYSRKMFTTGSWRQDLAAMYSWDVKAIKKVGGLAKYRKIDIRASMKSQQIREAGQDAAKAEADELKYVMDVFKGRPSVKGNVMAADDVVQSSQQSVVQNSVKSSSGLSSPKQDLLGQATGNGKKATLIYDDIEGAQHASFKVQRQASQNASQHSSTTTDGGGAFTSLEQAQFKAYMEKLFK